MRRYPHSFAAELLPMNEGRSEKSAEADLEQAFDWLIRLDEAPGDTAVHQAFDAWRSADPAHAHAFVRAQHLWGLTAQTAPDRSQWPTGAKPATPPAAVKATRKRRGRPRRYRRIGALIAAAAACVMVFVLGGIVGPWAPDYRTGVGETKRIALADGSIVYLGGNSAIDTDYAPGRRHIELLTGEAFFEVSPDAERPFVVDAQGLDVRVLGTAFNVELTGSSYRVSVQHGRVAVRYDGADHRIDRRLERGQQLSIVRTGNRDGLDRVETVDPANVAAWRSGRLAVADRSVADVADTLQRYYRGRIFIADDELAARRVSGSYRLADPDQALRAVIAPYDGTVREFTPFVRIVSGQ